MWDVGDLMWDGGCWNCGVRIFHFEFLVDK